MISDKGPQFAAELMRELNRMLGIKTKLSTLFHPQKRLLGTDQPLNKLH